MSEVGDFGQRGLLGQRRDSGQRRKIKLIFISSFDHKLAENILQGSGFIFINFADHVADQGAAIFLAVIWFAAIKADIKIYKNVFPDYEMVAANIRLHTTRIILCSEGRTKTIS